MTLDQLLSHLEFSLPRLTLEGLVIQSTSSLAGLSSLTKQELQVKSLEHNLK